MAEDRYTLFVGNLPRDIRTKELKDLFSKFDPKNVELRNSRTSDGCFGYVEFEHRRDAYDALQRMDGYDFDGYRIRVDYKKSPEFRMQRNDQQRSRPMLDYPFVCKINDIPEFMGSRDLKIFLKMYCTSECCELKDDIAYVAFFTKNDMNHAIKKFSTGTFDYKDKRVSIKLERVKSRQPGPKKSRSRSPSKENLKDDL